MVLRFIIAKLIDPQTGFAIYYLQMEVVTMIDRPLYVDKIMAYADTPVCKDTHRGTPLREIHNIEDDYGTVKDRAEYSG